MAPWGPEGRAGYGRPGGVGGCRLAFALRPCRDGSALAAAPRVLLEPNAPAPLRPPPKVVAGAGSAGPLVVHRVGPGPLSLALVGSAQRAAGSRSRFLPFSRRHPAAWVKAVCGFMFLSPNLRCPPGCPRTSPCFSHFPVMKTVVENRSSFFPRALAIFHTLRALLGRRIQCFGVCHSGIKLFLLVAPAWRRSSASPIATWGKGEDYCRAPLAAGGLTPAVC